MITDFVFTSQSVTEGHPDRLCHTISDAIVDAFRRQDATSRITAECALSNNVIFLATRFASEAIVDIPDIARHHQGRRLPVQGLQCGRMYRCDQSDRAIKDTPGN
jgi:S-adenosylmethionine synthetase